MHKEAEKEIKKAETTLEGCTPEEEDHRKTLSEKRRNLNEQEEEVRDVRTHMKDGKWFGVNERSSKLWFSLNKIQAKSAGIMSLIDPALNEETQNPKDMLEIARNHHSQQQSEPQMNKSRKRAIDTILAGIKKKLNEDEKEEINKEISYREVREALKKSPNSKAPGPDGIPNEFWKTELKWRKKMKKEKKFNQGEMAKNGAKERPRITALMTKRLTDIENFGTTDEKFSEARKGLLYK